MQKSTITDAEMQQYLNAGRQLRAQAFAEFFRALFSPAPEGERLPNGQTQTS